jgi:glycosyltransferase involved in cell wall biosynthesis
MDFSWTTDQDTASFSKAPARSGRDKGEELTPAVTIVIPCRNEKDYIEASLLSILSQEPPPGGFEIIVVDGVSTDGTRGILARLAQENQRLKLLDNPGKTTPLAMNLGIQNARGRYVAVLGAHTEYARSYIRTCVEVLEEHPEVCCAGGPIISRGKNTFGKATAIAMSHPVGIGNAKHRMPNYEGYAEGACFPVFRREIFAQVGFYDERLSRNQDDELNLRITRHGGKIFISPRAQCHYYVRKSPLDLLRQYFEYGYWRVAVLRKHRIPASVRQLAPALFFILLLGGLIVGSFLPAPWRLVTVIPPVLYIFILLAAGTRVAARENIFIGLTFPLAVAIMHVAYGAGFMLGILRCLRQCAIHCWRVKGGSNASSK